MHTTEPMESNGIAASSNEEFRAKQIGAWQAKRKRIDLPDGRVAFECDCGKTIANVHEIEGRRRLKIFLLGAKTMLITKRSGKRIRVPYEEDDPLVTAGKCPGKGCDNLHGFSMEEIAQALGAADVAELADSEGFDVPKCDADRLHEWFKSVYAWRADGTGKRFHEVDPFAEYLLPSGLTLKIDGCIMSVQV